MIRYIRYMGLRHLGMMQDGNSDPNVRLGEGSQGTEPQDLDLVGPIERRRGLGGVPFLQVGPSASSRSCSRRLTCDIVRYLEYRPVQIQVMCYDTGDKGGWVYRR